MIGVEDAIDIHCHAHEGQQDALGVAKLASKSGMKGILYKTIVGRKDPAGTVDSVRSALESWCVEKGLTPAHLWPGASVTQGFLSKIEPAWCAKNLKAGVVGLWMPNNTSANTLSIVGGKPSAWDKNADPKAHTEPLSWADSLRYGHYLLDDKGRLLPEIEEIFRMAHDQNAAIFFGHPTKPEFKAMAEFSRRPVAQLHLRRIVTAPGYRPGEHVQGHSHGGPRALHALVGRRRASVSQLGRVAPPATRLYVGFRLHS